MGLFSKKPAGVLGIDVGASAVKLVELVRESGRARLRTYGFTERRLTEASGDPREQSEEIGAIIRELCQRSGAKATTVIASLPTFSVFSSIITLPALPKKELADAIRREAKKLIPLPMEEMILNWELLLAPPKSVRMREESSGDASVKTVGDITVTSPASDTGKKTISVLITAAQKKLVEQYVAIFKASQLTLQSLETEAFALVRSLVGNDKSLIMVVDIGARNTDISMIDSGIPILNRSIDFGGKNFTDTIASVTKLPARIAEQVKRDIGEGKVTTALAALDSLFAPLLNEMQYIIGLSQSRDTGRVEKIILTGGSGLLFNLGALLTSRFNIPVTVGDPWARVATPVPLAPVLQAIGPRMSVAVGLAMRGI